MVKTLPQLIAHRGASAFAPENTLPAFELAQMFEAKMFECDVQLSSDNVPVIIHDDTVNRTTEGQGKIHELSAQELTNLPIKNNFKLDQYHFEYPFAIPTLQDTLTWCLKQKMPLNLELKVNRYALDAPLVEQVLKTIRPLPVALADLMLVSSFDWQRLSEFHEQAPEFAIGVLIDADNWQRAGITGIQAIVNEVDALSVNIDAALLTPELAQALKAISPFLLAYTVNDLKTAEALFAMGVDGIFSNNPLLLQKLT
jgi:glycerophosphoryl diester phosphodiesterase